MLVYLFSLHFSIYLYLFCLCAAVTAEYPVWGIQKSIISSILRGNGLKKVWTVSWITALPCKQKKVKTCRQFTFTCSAFMFCKFIKTVNAVWSQRQHFCASRTSEEKIEGTNMQIVQSDFSCSPFCTISSCILIGWFDWAIISNLKSFSRR